MRLIVLLLSHSCVLVTFGNVMISEVIQSHGKTSISQTLLIISYMTVATVTSPALMTSTGIPSSPGAGGSMAGVQCVLLSFYGIVVQ